MSPKTDLIARLEAEAARWEKTQQEHVGMAEHCGKYGNHGSAMSWVATANNAGQHAADLRAAAAAVRLVAECREALSEICETYSTDTLDELWIKANVARTAIADWEGEYGQ